jgi:hypothetical protein
MGLSVVLLAVATFFTYRDYLRGRVVRDVVKKMLTITVLVAVLFVFILITTFVVGGSPL